MRILLTGRNGQVGWELERSLARIGEILAFDRSSLDLADPDQIVKRVRAIRPDLIVNAAAYTAVDRAESEPELALRINAGAPEVLAAEALRLGAALIHYSTDYVFDGTKAAAYVETDPPNPLSVYGRSKLQGERAVQASGCKHLILRTSWVYGARGTNFLLTMLRLARERRELRVVDDQIGAPTWCRDIAAATADLAEASAEGSIQGLYHVTAAGKTSWCRFASTLLEIAGIRTPVRPISTSQFPSVAKRPANSVLSCAKVKALGIELPEWHRSVSACMAEVAIPT